MNKVAIIETLAREIADSYFVDGYEAMDVYGSDYYESLTSDIESMLWDDKRRKGLIADFKGMLDSVPDCLVHQHVEIIRRMKEL